LTPNAIKTDQFSSQINSMDKLTQGDINSGETLNREIDAMRILEQISKPEETSQEFNYDYFSSLLASSSSSTPNSTPKLVKLEPLLRFEDHFEFEPFLEKYEPISVEIKSEPRISEMRRKIKQVLLVVNILIP
jgi:hypothetical protein